MVSEKSDIHAIFNEAVSRDSDEERSRYLDEACGNDVQVRSRVEALLHAHSEAGGFLGGQSPLLGAREVRPVTEQAGDTIGPYVLLQQIGEGGMGVVYMAEQTEPLQRRVALKIIKPGMDTRQVIARFEAERQALAVMDHPNIARVLDAGKTDTGRPYFVMELVQGVPITDYCDEHRLTTRERLELFLPVCQAVQHAHQKGIIHRDVKPSNVLVAHYDEQPVPKIIDFGVAKAISQPLAERTLFTQYGQIVGTLEYMSPEQAQLNQLDVDTRTDIYALGVLLYELLTGTPAFDGARLRSAALDEKLRIIREEEPPKPSTRLTDSKDTLPSISAQRRTEPAVLMKLICGELDWIVMKALEKDRNRRYETASKFADDVQHYLDDEPVVACPPSSTYLMGKFARRNKGWLLTAAAVLLTAFVGLTLSTILIARERDAAEAASQREAIAAEEANRQRLRAEENLRESRAAVDRLFTRAAEELDNVPHMTEVQRALLADAAEFYELFVKQKSDDLEIREEMAHAYERLGDAYWHLARYEEAVAVARKSLAIYEGLSSEFPDRIDLKRHLSEFYSGLAAWLGDVNYHGAPETRPYGDKALRIAEELARQRPNDPEIRREYVQRQEWLFNDVPTRIRENEPYARKAIVLWEQLRADFPQLNGLNGDEAHGRHWIGAFFAEIGQLEEAELQYRRSVELYTKAIEESPRMVYLKRNLAHVERDYARLLKDRGRLAEANEHFQHSIELLRPLLDDFPGMPLISHLLRVSYGGKAQVHIALGQLDEAEQTLLRSLLLPRPSPQNHWGTSDLAQQFYNLGLIFHHKGQTVLAAEMFREAFAGFEQALSKASPNTPMERDAKGALRWRLVTCPLLQFRDAERSIQYSKEFLQQEPEANEGWNALGIGYYRAGDWGKAIEALEKAAELRNGVDRGECYFLAMAHWRRGEEGQAHQWYQRGLRKEQDARATLDLDLVNFRREAEKLLSFSEEEPAGGKTTDTQPAHAETTDAESHHTMPPEGDNQTNPGN